jgi:iron complex transport system ATP-binding protein
MERMVRTSIGAFRAFRVFRRIRIEQTPKFLGARKAMLKIENLTVDYGTRRVLRDVSLDVRSGEVLALIGPNGAGKSTLIRAASGVVPIQGGFVRTNGDDFAQLETMQRARCMAVVPQGAALPPAFSVWETVMLGRTPYLGFLGQPSEKDEELARRALERVDALGLAERRVGEVSGGEAQRVLLARALCQSTPILLLDEPTAQLDLHHQMSLLELVRELAHADGLAVLIALHDLNLAARYADRVALLVLGEIKAIGKPKQVLKRKLLSQAYGWPVRVVDHPLVDAPLVLPESGK